MSPGQAVMIITIKEPDNPEYQDFLHDLRNYAHKLNYTMESTLVSGGATERCNHTLIST